jgi:hypothetical protein
MATGPIGEPVQVRVLESPPDPDLPGAVVVLDDRLAATAIAITSDHAISRISVNQQRRAFRNP